MNVQSHADVLQQAYAAFGRRDIPAVLSYRGSSDRGSPIPPARCDHDHPILLLAADEGRRRGFCLGCTSVGPIRQGPLAARLALIEART
jgi:hypothetical protein